MNAKNTEKLLAAYPLLYRDLRNRQFECGDGWFNLVWQMSADIESASSLEGIPKEPLSWPSITVLKEKIGELRVSFGFSVKVSEEIRALAFKASMRATWICKECGLPKKSTLFIRPRTQP